MGHGKSTAAGLVLRHMESVIVHALTKPVCNQDTGEGGQMEASGMDAVNEMPRRDGRARAI